MLVPQRPTPVNVEVRSDGEGVTLASAGLRLRAQRQPWQLAAYDREGRQFFSPAAPRPRHDGVRRIPHRLLDR